MLLCALVLLSCVNGAVAVDSELESQSWANETSDSVTAETSISDGFSSTADWLKGKGMSAYSKAKSAANYSQSILESSTKKFSDEMLVAYRRGGDAAVISASGIWRNTFPLCIELGSVVRLKVNETLDKTIENVFKFQACTKNISSPKCLAYIEDQVINTIFNAMWGPFKVTLGGSSFIVSVALGRMDGKVKKHFRPYLLAAARPAAAVIHYEIKKHHTKVISEGKLKTTDEVLTALKWAVSLVKDHLFRKTENSVGRICKAIGLKGNTRDGKAQWTDTCRNNTKLNYGLQVKGRDFSIGLMDAPWDMKNVDMLRLFFPSCTWDSSSVKGKYWIMKNCTCWGGECNRCAYAEICGMMCAEGKKCKQFSFHGESKLTWQGMVPTYRYNYQCVPKYETGPLLAKETHLSGPPVKMCFMWTQIGVDFVTKQNKTREYDEPVLDGKVTSKVEGHFRSSKYLKTAIQGKMIKSISCPQYAIVSLASSLHALWVSLAVVGLALV